MDSAHYLLKFFLKMFLVSRCRLQRCCLRINKAGAELRQQRNKRSEGAKRIYAVIATLLSARSNSTISAYRNQRFRRLRFQAKKCRQETITLDEHIAQCTQS